MYGCVYISIGLERRDGLACVSVCECLYCVYIVCVRHTSIILYTQLAKIYTYLKARFVQHLFIASTTADIVEHLIGVCVANRTKAKSSFIHVEIYSISINQIPINPRGRAELYRHYTLYALLVYIFLCVRLSSSGEK